MRPTARRLLAASALAGALCSARAPEARAQSAGPRLVHLERSLALGTAVPFELLLMMAPVRMGVRLFASLPGALTLPWDGAARFFATRGRPGASAHFVGEPTLGALIMHFASPSSPPPSHSFLDRVRATFGWVPSVVPHARWTDYGLSIEGISLGLSGSF